MRSPTFYPLIALVALSPAPFGAVGAWSWGTIACAVGLLLLVHGLAVLFGWAEPGPGPRRIWPFALPFGLTLVWVAVQAFPLTPSAWHHPLWRSGEAALGTELASAISLDASETISGMIRLLAYGGIFWLSLAACRSGTRARRACLAVTYIVLAYCVYGLAVEFSGSKTILWFEVNRVSVVATYVNYNNFATYAGLGLICATGLVLAGFAGLGDAFSRRRWLHGLLDLLSPHAVILPLTWIVLATALLMSFSRGGFLSTMLGLAALLLAYSRAHAIRTASAVALATTVAVVGLALYLYSGEVVDLRLARVALDSDGRTNIYELVLAAIAERPLFGTGYGTFADVFRLHRDEDLAREVVKAHNSYLEVALELGLPAAGLLLLSFVLLFVRCLIGVATRRFDAVYPCIGVGASVLVGAHALVDFSLQIPGVAVTYAFIMGVAVAQSWPSAGSVRSAGPVGTDRAD